ncbi:MAG: bifunctional nicotinamidase/pyrazinamidase [Rhodobacteraceae bacterium]|nr:bifunctional nicotinamidase/pyrazinamidase [Paracoccaceae bacterium]
MEEDVRPQTEALIVIDIQNDFCEGGALEVPGGSEIVQPVNALMQDFRVVVLSQDWHPARHSSFASEHPGKQPLELIEMPYGPQVLWPDHCIQGSVGAAFHPDLDVDCADLILRKGFRREIDSYSAFYENDRTTPTGLHGYLRERGVTRVVVVGLALDFCVQYSAVDAATHGFETVVLPEFCRAIDVNGSLDDARRDFVAHGVRQE